MASNLDPPATPPRALSVLARVAVIAVAIVIGVVTAAVIALETPWGVRSVASLALGIFNPWPGTHAEVRGAAGGFLDGLELRGVRLSSARGQTFASLDTLRVEYRLHEVIASGHRLRRATVAGLTIDFTDWPALAPSRPSSRPKSTAAVLLVDALTLRRGAVDWQMPPRGRDSLWWGREVMLQIRGFRVAGGLVLGRVATLEASFGPREAPAQRFGLAASGDLGRDALRDLHLSIDGDSTHVFAAGTCGAPDSLHRFAGTDLAVGFGPLAARDVRRYFPSAVDPGDVTLDARLRRDGALLIAHVAASGTRAARLDLDARVTPTTSGPVVLWARGQSHAIDWGAWTGGAPGQLVVDGTIDADLHGPSLDRLDGSLEVNLDGSRVSGRRLERAGGSARFAAGRADLRVEARSEGFVLHASGDAQPFADPPTWRLAPSLTIPPRDAHGATPPAGERALVAGTLTSEVNLRGRAFAEWVGTVALALRPDSARDPLLGEGRVDVRFDRGTARWEAALEATDGRVTATGRVVQRGAEISYAVDTGEVRGVDIAALLGSRDTSRLDARWRLEGTGLAPAAARASGHVGGLALHYGSHRLEADAIDLELRDGPARAPAAARLDRAQLELRAAPASLTHPRQPELQRPLRRL